MAGEAPYYSFYQPFCSVVIVRPNGTRFPLQPVFTPTAVPGGFEADVVSYLNTEELRVKESNGLTGFPFVSSVDLSFNLGMYPNISVTLTPPYREAIAFINSELVEYNNTLEVQMGYVYGPSRSLRKSPIFSALMLNPEVILGADCSITLSGAAGTAGLKAIRAEGKSRSYDSTPSTTTEGAGWTRFLILKQELQEAALGDILDIDISLVESLSSGNRFLTEVISYNTGGVTVQEVMSELIMECGLLYYIDYPGSDRVDGQVTRNKETLVIFPREKMMNLPSYILTLYDQPGQFGQRVNPDGQIRGVFPILNVGSPTLGGYLPLESAGILWNYADKSQSRKNDGEPDIKSTEVVAHATTLGNGFICTNEEYAPNIRKRYYEAAGSPRSIELMKTELERSRMAMGVRLEIDTLGMPDCYPGDIVNVRGIGQRFSNIIENYCVFEARHTYDSSGLMTHLSCVSNSNAFIDSKNLNERNSCPETPKNVSVPRRAITTTVGDATTRDDVEGQAQFSADFWAQQQADYNSPIKLKVPKKVRTVVKPARGSAEAVTRDSEELVGPRIPKPADPAVRLEELKMPFLHDTPYKVPDQFVPIQPPMLKPGLGG